MSLFISSFFSSRRHLTQPGLTDNVIDKCDGIAPKLVWLGETTKQRSPHTSVMHASSESGDGAGGRF